MSSRENDIVLFGASGFTGGLTAEYLARHAPEGVRWSIAGRSERKLRELADRLAGEPRPPAGVVVADVADDASVRAMARRTRVLITTVGPYEKYGEPVVHACAEEATDYVDLTGEPTFVQRMITRHHDRARERGAKIVHCCGFDSIPPDLGVLFTLDALPRGGSIEIDGFVATHGGASGGTWHSAIGILADPRGVRDAQKRAQYQHGGRRGRLARPSIRYEQEVRGWACPLPTIDPLIILRSARLLDEYGPDFAYGHYLRVRRLPRLIGLGAGVGALFALAQLPPTRALLLKLKDPGEGPSEAQRAEAWFRLTFVGRAGDARVVTEVAGGDPGYGETSKMLAESALCLALDRERTPDLTGVLTPAAAMGRPLIERLQRAGISFRRLHD